MKNIAIDDEEEGICLYSGMVLTERDICSLERIFSGLLDKIRKAEKHAPTPEGTRLNILEYVHETLQKAQAKTSKVLEELKAEVATLSRRQNINRKVHTKLYKEIDEHSKVIDRIKYTYIQDVEGRKRREKRLSDIEEFLGDL